MEKEECKEQLIKNYNWLYHNKKDCIGNSIEDFYDIMIESITRTVDIIYEQGYDLDIVNYTRGYIDNKYYETVCQKSLSVYYTLKDSPAYEKIVNENAERLVYEVKYEIDKAKSNNKKFVLFVPYYYGSLLPVINNKITKKLLKEMHKQFTVMIYGSI